MVSERMKRLPAIAKTALLMLTAMLAGLSCASPISAQDERPPQEKAAGEAAQDKAAADKAAQDKAAADKAAKNAQAGETADPREDRPLVIVVTGASGAEEFAATFRDWSNRWSKAAKSAEAGLIEIGSGEHKESDRDRLREAITAAPPEGREPIWIVLIGHGTFDGRSAKFNLRGRDVTAKELKQWLEPVSRPVAIINCASASAPFLKELSAPTRVVVTATKSGYQYNYARFGDFISKAIVDVSADLDKDGQTSLLEGFLAASKRVNEFYKQEGRLATESALLDDNGDQLGAPATLFRGVRPARAAKDGAEIDGLRANQIHLIRSTAELALEPAVRARRDEIEEQIDALRKQKETLAADAYYAQLEKLVVELAHIYEP